MLFFHSISWLIIIRIWNHRLSPNGPLVTHCKIMISEYVHSLPCACRTWLSNPDYSCLMSQQSMAVKVISNIGLFRTLNRMYLQNLWFSINYLFSKIKGSFFSAMLITVSSITPYFIGSNWLLLELVFPFEIYENSSLHLFFKQILCIFALDLEYFWVFVSDEISFFTWNVSPNF